MIKTLFRAFLVGLGVGVLVAPRAGSETRRLLSEKLNNVVGSAGELADKVEKTVNSAKNESYVPSQHYVQNTETREVGSPESKPM